jgi:hypothetical protein
MLNMKRSNKTTEKKTSLIHYDMVNRNWIPFHGRKKLLKCPALYLRVETKNGKSLQLILTETHNSNIKKSCSDLSEQDS